MERESPSILLTHAGLYGARWGVVKALHRVGDGAVGSLPWGVLAVFPLTWPWGPMFPLQNVDTHYPLWGSGTLAASGCPYQPEMTLMCPGQGNHVRTTEGRTTGISGSVSMWGGAKGIKHGWLGVWVYVSSGAILSPNWQVSSRLWGLGPRNFPEVSLKDWGQMG